MSYVAVVGGGSLAAEWITRYLAAGLDVVSIDGGATVGDEVAARWPAADRLGLFPRARLTVEEVAPFGGPLLVQVNGARYAIGRDVAAKILVGK